MKINSKFFIILFLISIIYLIFWYYSINKKVNSFLNINNFKEAQNFFLKDYLIIWSLKMQEHFCDLVKKENIKIESIDFWRNSQKFYIISSCYPKWIWEEYKKTLNFKID
jgi:hypothetical protein